MLFFFMIFVLNFNSWIVTSISGEALSDKIYMDLTKGDKQLLI